MLRKVPFVKPMLPTLVNSVPADAGWLHEPIFDGTRVQVHLENGDFTIYDSNGRDVTQRFRRLGEMLSALPDGGAMIDAKLVACDASGHPAFSGRIGDADADCPLCLWCFDLLAIDGKKLLNLPLSDRKERLAELITAADEQGLQFAGGFDDGVKLLAAAKRMGLHAIVSKRRESPYRSGPSRDWLKINIPD
jgi:bifunctional non-homologous end joining protein LigD